MADNHEKAVPFAGLPNLVDHSFGGPAAGLER